MSQHTIPISVDELQVGVVCSHPVESESGVLLLGANTRITQQLISGLRDRGIVSIEIDPRDLATIRRRVDEGNSRRGTKRARSTNGQWPKSVPVKEMLIDRFEQNLCEERAERLTATMSQAKLQMESLKEQVCDRSLRTVAQLSDISEDYADSIVDDHDQTVGAVGNTMQSLPLAERSVRMAALGMAVAIEVGMDGPQMLEVGMAGLLHDVGLYAMDPKYLDPTAELSPSEFWEYQKHPNVSVDRISDVIDVTESVQLTVQQIHEQFDGSGYPRGLKGNRIHQNARILNIVDSYLRLTSPGPIRRAIVPHDALGLILHLASRGVYDPQMVRAFLNTASLFPLGSQVELSDGGQALVIRRPRIGFAAPVLMVENGQRIEMESASLRIVRPVCNPELNQVRLSPEKMESSAWHPAGPNGVI